MTNLKRIIDEKGVQQRWLAEQVGVTEVSMSRYVNGERIPKAPMAIRMADVLGVDVKELYGWDDKHVVGEPEQPETHDKRTETHARDCIERQAAIDVLEERLQANGYSNVALVSEFNRSIGYLMRLPSAQPEIIRCNDCKHWTQTTGNMRGFGLGDCDYINAKLVNCNGFCYWAERRTDEE
jgi:transcriptional regulator with XRE-family HTH domain